MRNSVQTFIRLTFIENLILGMTIFLCVVIFAEMGIPPYLITIPDYDGGKEPRTVLGQIFYVINYFLLTFFVIEIALKLFADGLLFLMEFINVFDSIVVFISFAF